MLSGSSGPGFISQGLSCVLDSLAAAGSVHVQGVYQYQWQGKQHMFSSSSLQKICFKIFNIWLTLLNCISRTAVLLVDTSHWDPKRQQHGSRRAVCPQQSVTSVRSFLPAVVPLTATPGNPLTTRITQIYPSTGQHGICFSFHMWLLIIPIVGEVVKCSPPFCSRY